MLVAVEKDFGVCNGILVINIRTKARWVKAYQIKAQGVKGGWVKAGRVKAGQIKACQAAKNIDASV